MEDFFKPYELLAEKLGYEFGYSDMTEPILLGRGGDDPILKSKFCYLTKGDILFWAFDSFGVKFGTTQTYSGLYRWVKLPDPAFQCRMEKYFFLDFLLKGKRDKLGIPEIDKQVTLHTNNEMMARRIITPSLVKSYLSLFRKLKPVELVIGNEYIPRFKGHENEQLVGLETNRWYAAEELESNLGLMAGLIHQVRVL